MYGINDGVYNNLIRYFKDDCNIISVTLFGSRAKGNEEFNSDIDLCIKCNKGFKGSIQYKIDEIIGIYFCYIVFVDSLNEELEKQIKRDGIIIYEK